MKAIRNKNSFEHEVLLVSDDMIEKGLMNDTYNNYGQPISSYEAGDWCFYNPDFMDRAKEAAEVVIPNINWDNYNIYAIGIFEVEIDSVYSIDPNSKETSEIQSVMNKWATDNYQATEATYINYWDGHNFKSIVLECEQFSDCLEWELLDDTQASFYIDLFNRANFGSWDCGQRRDIVDGYEITQSQWESNFEIARIEQLSSMTIRDAIMNNSEGYTREELQRIEIPELWKMLENVAKKTDFSAYDELYRAVDEGF